MQAMVLMNLENTVLWKEPDTEGRVLYDPTAMKSPEEANP